MRSIAYIIAALAAVGLAIGIANYPSEDSGDAAQSSTAVASAVPVSAEAGEMTLAVPEMHCQFSCFPRVKETLEGSPAVETVELAPQSSENALDNRQVIVHFAPGFDAGAAIKTLAAEGFTDSTVVQ